MLPASELQGSKKSECKCHECVTVTTEKKSCVAVTDVSWWCQCFPPERSGDSLQSVTWLTKAQLWSLAVVLDRNSHKVKGVLTQGWGQGSGALLCFVPDLKWSGSSLEGGRDREMVGL